MSDSCKSCRTGLCQQEEASSTDSQNPGLVEKESKRSNSLVTVAGTEEIFYVAQEPECVKEAEVSEGKAVEKKKEASFLMKKKKVTEVEVLR